MAWTWRHTLVAALAAMSLGLAFAIKHPCTTNDWDDHFQYKHYCYSDILPIYYAHGHDQDVTPYVDETPDGVNEYPVGSAYFSHAVARMTEGLHDFMVLTFLLLLAAGAATSWALWRLAGQGAVVAWAAAPTVPIHGLTNWDLLAVGLAAWGWHEWRAKRRFASALLFGLGGAAKLYPAFFLPLLFFGVLRAEWPLLRVWWSSRIGRSGQDADADPAADTVQTGAPGPAASSAEAGPAQGQTSARAPRGFWSSARGTLMTLAGGTLGFAGPNLAAALAGRDAWMASWRFHAERHPDFETPWQSFLKPLLQPLFPDFDWGQGWADLVADLGLLAMAATLLWLVWRIWRHEADPLAAGGVLVLVFLLTNRVYSPQYTLWALPILILLRAGWVPSVLYITADTVNFIVRYRLFTPPPGGEGWDMAWEPWSRFAVNMRWVFLLWATWTIVRRHGLAPGGDGDAVEVDAPASAAPATLGSRPTISPAQHD